MGDKSAPSSSSCPTGMLVDLSLDDNNPSTSAVPPQLLTMAEFDDTFGLFKGQQPQAPLIPPPDGGLLLNCSSGSTNSPFGLGLGPLRQKNSNNQVKNLTPLGRVRGMGGRDPFSPLLRDSPIDPFSPVPRRGGGGESPFKKRRASEGTPVSGLAAVGNRTVSVGGVGDGCGGSLSDSDSILEIENLSGFSVSDTEETMDELIEKLKVAPPSSAVRPTQLFRRHSESSAMFAKRKEDLMKKYNQDKDLENQKRESPTTPEKKEEESDPVVRERRRRESLCAKLDTLRASLVTSPIMSPCTSPSPTPIGKPIFGGNYIPTPSRRTLSSVSWSQRQNQPVPSLSFSLANEDPSNAGDNNEELGKTIVVPPPSSLNPNSTYVENLDLEKTVIIESEEVMESQPVDGEVTFSVPAPVVKPQNKEKPIGIAVATPHARPSLTTHDNLPKVRPRVIVPPSPSAGRASLRNATPASTTKKNPLPSRASITAPTPPRGGGRTSLSSNVRRGPPPSPVTRPASTASKLATKLTSPLRTSTPAMPNKASTRIPVPPSPASSVTRYFGTGTNPTARGKFTHKPASSSTAK